MGKRLAMPSEEDGYGYEIVDEDSDGFDVLEKISIMNEAGALITEVVGLSEDCQIVFTISSLSNLKLIRLVTFQRTSVFHLEIPD